MSKVTDRLEPDNPTAAVDGLKWARKDENIKLIFNTSEDVFSPKVNIAGVEINAFPRDFDTTGTQWEATTVWKIYWVICWKARTWC